MYEKKRTINQNPVAMIASIFNKFPVNIQMIEDKNKFICNMRKNLYKYEYYEFFVCKFDA